MNSVILVGRLTKDPEVRYGAASQSANARFTLAIDRGRDRNGEDRGADFIPIVCFGKQAELVEKYLTKGRQVAVQGRIQTGSYEKDGRKVYTTDVIADRVEFLGSAQDGQSRGFGGSAPQSRPEEDEIPGGLNKTDDDDIPF